MDVKEYTVLSVASVLAAILLDGWSGVRLLRRREYRVLLAVIFVMKVIVNGYLTGMMGNAIVLYEPHFFLGIRLITIPLEDFGFGFGMITLSIVVWEWLGQRRTAKGSSAPAEKG
jgi:lycopene cyclase domain-containing protein